MAGGKLFGREAFPGAVCGRAAVPGSVCGIEAVAPGSAYGSEVLAGGAGGIVAEAPGSAYGWDAPAPGAGGSEGVRARGIDCGGRDETCGVYEAPGSAGAGSGVPGCVKEPIGGGPFETGGATGACTSEPGSGGATAAGTGCGRAIWPTSGTVLGAGAGAETGAVEKDDTGLSAGIVADAVDATGLPPSADALLFKINFATRLICTTASRHSVPQATAEERSRSDDRMVEGRGVTGC